MMTQEQQRIEVAESLGWKWYRSKTTGDITTGIVTFNTNLLGDWEEIPRPENYLNEAVAFVNCPDYPNDLDAMHEAEKRLKPHRMSGSESTPWSDYFMTLLRICEREKVSSGHASAALRCEAYLRTIHRWKD